MTAPPMARFARVLAVGVLVAVLVVLTPAPASAREHATLAVGEGTVTRNYPGIAGTYPAHRPAEPGQCAAAACDVIPVTIDPPSTASGDALLAFTVTWDARDGNVLNAAFFTTDPPPDGDAGRNTSTGLIKWTTGGAAGSLVVRTANPKAGRFNLTIANTTGENRGYSVAAELARRAATPAGQGDPDAAGS